MINILPQHATKYLVESLNKRTTQNIKLELAEALGATKTPKAATGNRSSESSSGGYGVGVGEQETDTSKNFTNVLQSNRFNRNLFYSNFSLSEPNLNKTYPPN